MKKIILFRIGYILMIKEKKFDSTLNKEFVTAITSPDAKLLSNYEQAIYNAYYYAKREIIPAVPKKVTDLLVYSSIIISSI